MAAEMGKGSRAAFSVDSGWAGFMWEPMDVVNARHGGRSQLSLRLAEKAEHLAISLLFKLLFNLFINRLNCLVMNMYTTYCWINNA